MKKKTLKNLKKLLTICMTYSHNFTLEQFSGVSILLIVF